MIRSSLLSRCFIFVALLLAACTPSPTAFPTAGVTVQAFPNVEISTPSATPTETAAPAPTDTPTLEATATPTDTPLPTDTPVPPTLTNTTLAPQPIQPTATKRIVVTNPPRPKATNTAAPPSAGPITFRAVQFVRAVPDPARPPDGSLDTLSVEFAGSRPPFTLKHDGQAVTTNPNGDGKFENAGVNYTFIYFTIAKTCGGQLVGTVTVAGGDGQTFTHDYFIANAPCS